MLKSRIIATLRFFALQDIPLTLFEVHKYLLADVAALKQHLGPDWEVVSTSGAADQVSIGEVAECLQNECQQEVKSFRGYYYLANDKVDLVTTRLHNYLFAIKREQIIKYYTPLLRYVPFLRSVGLVGSQALGLPRPASDIDVLLIVEPRFMGLARFFVTLYFQLAGVRRHHNKIANRFCPNHYLAGPKVLQRDRNIYTASEYLKARAIYHAGVLADFKANNWPWLKLFFPNAKLFANKKLPYPWLKMAAEKLLTNRFGLWLESTARAYQFGRIERSEFVVVEDDELSFHPHNRKAELFAAFFESQEQDHGKAV